jgi:hypothetical protein
VTDVTSSFCFRLYDFLPSFLPSAFALLPLLFFCAMPYRPAYSLVVLSFTYSLTCLL